MRHSSQAEDGIGQHGRVVDRGNAEGHGTGGALVGTAAVATVAGGHGQCGWTVVIE